MIHSHTAIKTWNTCPRQYKARYIDKVVPFQKSPAADRGIRIHRALEAAVKGDHSLMRKENIWTPDGLVDLFARGEAVPEEKLAIRRDMTPCDFWDKSAWLRGAIDVRLVRSREALLVDWKAGRVYPDPLQADIYTTMLRAREGSDLKVTFYYVYVDQQVVIAERPDSAAEERVVANIEAVEADTTFDPKPNALCRYCPVFSCEYNGG